MSRILVFSDDFALLKQLVSKAQMLSSNVAVCLIGFEIENTLLIVQDFALENIYYSDQKIHSEFHLKNYAQVMLEAIDDYDPNIVLVGTSDLGKSLASHVATLLHTGVTADCTDLKIENNQLIQIRPAFGGNVMAQIVTKAHKIQFATIRKGVFKEDVCLGKFKVSYNKIELKENYSLLEYLSVNPKCFVSEIDRASLVFIAGSGFKQKEDLKLLEAIAAKYNGVVACTRALVEKGWYPSTKQVGLSGHSLNADLVVTFGVSGSIQFMSGLTNCKTVVAINNDPCAPIFKKASYSIIEDLYSIIDKI